jgi:hypothetical protein
MKVMAVTTALPGTAPYGWVWMIALLFGPLSFAAVQEMRTDCRVSDPQLQDGYGTFIIDGFGRPITLQRKRRCQLAVSNVRVLCPLWSD